MRNWALLHRNFADLEEVLFKDVQLGLSGIFALCYEEIPVCERDHTEVCILEHRVHHPHHIITDILLHLESEQNTSAISHQINDRRDLLRDYAFDLIAQHWTTLSGQREQLLMQL